MAVVAARGAVGNINDSDEDFVGIFLCGAMIIAAAVSAAVCLNCGQTRHDDLFEQNLDALARGEGGGSSVMCSQTKNSGNYYMKDCSTCDKFNYYSMDKVGYCN